MSAWTVFWYVLAACGGLFVAFAMGALLMIGGAWLVMTIIDKLEAK